MLSERRVLDAGLVRLLAVLGDDGTPVDAARVSFEKRARRLPDGRVDPREERLLRFLMARGHWSPFRHAVLQFEIYAPLMVIRQWGKYRVGSVWAFGDSDCPLETWNESSRRYVTEEVRFHVPDSWRSAPESRKQGSGPPVTEEISDLYRTLLQDHARRSLELYEAALSDGLAPEQARLFLPAYALYVRAWWTVSLQGVLHFLSQRLAEDAQKEIREYAQAVAEMVEERFPLVMKVWRETGGKA